MNINTRVISQPENENTFASIDEAINQHSQGVVLNVQISRDGTPILFKEGTVDRVTDAAGFTCYYSDIELSELLAFGESIHTLEEGLSYLHAQKEKLPENFVIHLDIRAAKVATPVISILRALVANGAWSPQQFLISSLDQPCLKQFEKNLPAFPRAVELIGVPSDYGVCAGVCRAQSVIVGLDFISPALIADIKMRKANVLVSGIKTPEMIGRLIDMGVSGVLTSSINKMVDHQLTRAASA